MAYSGARQARAARGGTQPGEAAQSSARQQTTTASGQRHRRADRFSILASLGLQWPQSIPGCWAAFWDALPPLRFLKERSPTPQQHDLTRKAQAARTKNPYHHGAYEANPMGRPSTRRLQNENGYPRNTTRGKQKLKRPTKEDDHTIPFELAWASSAHPTRTRPPSSREPQARRACPTRGRRTAARKATCPWPSPPPSPGRGGAHETKAVHFRG